MNSIQEWFTIQKDHLPHIVLVSARQLHRPIVVLVEEVSSNSILSKLLQDADNVLGRSGPFNPFWAVAGTASIRVIAQWIRETNEVRLSESLDVKAPVRSSRMNIRSEPPWTRPQSTPPPASVTSPHPSVLAAQQRATIQRNDSTPVAPHAGYIQPPAPRQPFLQTPYNRPVVPARVPPAQHASAATFVGGPLVPNHPAATRGAGCRSCAQKASSSNNFGWF